MFQQSDFCGDTAFRLRVIINYKLGLKVMTEFSSLSPLKQKEFNKLLNEYIKALPDDWEPKIVTEFNEIAYDQILHDMKPEQMLVPPGDKTLLLTEEQQKLKDEGLLQL
jgi:hypothetical protein